MPESPEYVIREYIDFVNKQVCVYMDAIAGFEGNYVRIERQVHRINKAIKKTVDKDGQQVIMRASFEDPSKPDAIHQRIIRAKDFLEANSEGGSNTQQHSQAVLIFLITYWEDEIRPRLATAKNVDVLEIGSDIMGDLRIIRNVILHSKGIIRPDKHRSLKKLKNMFVENQTINVSYENMHQIFVLIKQDCTRIIYESLGIENPLVKPEEIVDVAIQRGHPN